MKKNKVIPIRINQDEYDLIKKAAEANKTTMAEIIRSGGLIWAEIRQEAVEEMETENRYQ